MHIPVLLNETIEGLSLKDGEILVDCTFGLGGHSEKACSSCPNLEIIGVDLNGDTLFQTEERLRAGGCHIRTSKNNFRDVDRILDGFGIERADKFLFDLGWSSVEFEESKRGFSFLRDEPLLMTYSDASQDTLTNAHEIVNTWQEDSLEAVIGGYGEERNARKIAKAICEARRKKPIDTTFELLEAIRPAFPRKLSGKIHFATRTFQAIRIAANDELESLKEGLTKAHLRINNGGRIAVISFHSLEDRIVKNFFKEIEKNNKGKIITKKPITPTREEIKNNPRSRSAKLRIIEIND